MLLILIYNLPYKSPNQYMKVITKRKELHLKPIRSKPIGLESKRTVDLFLFIANSQGYISYI